MENYKYKEIFQVLDNLLYPQMTRFYTLIEENKCPVPQHMMVIKQFESCYFIFILLMPRLVDKTTKIFSTNQLL